MQSDLRAREWASVAPTLAETLHGYVEQMRVTLRANSMPHIERTLPEFALWLGDEAPEVKAVRIFAARTSSATSATWRRSRIGVAGGCRSGR